MKKGLFFFLAALTPFLVQAAVSEWQIDPAQSSLAFTATQNGAPVSGEFKKFTGEIFVDPANFQVSRVRIVVDMNSLSMAYSDIKDALISPDWFNVNIFPKAEFKSHEFKKIGENRYQAIGTLTIRDKSVPVTLTFTAESQNKDNGIVTGSTILKRSAFGVGQGEWKDTNQVKDEVKVEFKVVARKK